MDRLPYRRWGYPVNSGPRGTGGNRTPIACSSDKCLDQLGNHPNLLLSLLGSNQDSSEPKSDVLPNYTKGQCDYFRNLFKRCFTNLNLTLISLGSCLIIFRLDSNVPVNTSFLFIFYFSFLRKTEESNP